MAADFNPLDTTQRGKVENIIRTLADLGMSPEEINAAFQRVQAAGERSLQDYYNSAGLAIGQQFQPTFQGARDFLGANPLLADSGYANRLNRQILTDLGGRLTSDYGQHAAAMSANNVNFLQGLENQRFGYRNALGQQAYQTMTGLPRKQSTGSKFAKFGGQLLGTGLGALIGGPAGAAVGSQLGAGQPNAGGFYPGVSNDQFMPQYSQPYRYQGWTGALGGGY